MQSWRASTTSSIGTTRLQLTHEILIVEHFGRTQLDCFSIALTKDVGIAASVSTSANRSVFVYLLPLPARLSVQR
jgi:hypothetical protein